MRFHRAGIIVSTVAVPGNRITTNRLSGSRITHLARIDDQPSQLPILRSVPDHVIGPGHNSFAISPSGREELIVYHAWDVARTARQMRIDRLHWVGGSPAILKKLTQSIVR